MINATIAKELLLPIPKENFVVGEFTDGVGSCCLIGHVQRLTSKNPLDYSHANCMDGSSLDNPLGYELRRLTNKFLSAEHRLEYRDGSDVNNSPSVNGYTENNPKDRIMHLLDDMIAKGY